MEELPGDIIKRISSILGESICFEEPVGNEDETVEEIRLDPLALDQQIAAQKAAREGKDPLKSAGTSISQASKPVYVPSKSEPLSPADYKTLMVQDFPEFKGMKAGEVSEERMYFVSWDLVQRYPESYIGKTNRPKAARFFEAMTEEQIWDFFYVYHPRALDSAPFIFVPTKQFDHFLDVVNASIQTKLTIPPGKPSEKFHITFGSSCSVRPKYLGRSMSHNEYKALQHAIPPPEMDDACQDVTAFGLEMLMANLNAHKERDVEKSKVKKKKQKKARDRDDSIYDAQLYLGLRPLASVKVVEAKKLAFNEPVPYVLDKEVVFICIDIEVAEEHHGTILEVGISTLDTKDIIGVPPGAAGRNWFPHIKSRHLHTEDYKFIRNRKYVRGCPELFDFGESEHPRIKELPGKIIAAFDALSGSGQESIPKEAKRFRNIVLVGHDINADLGYLASMDVHPWSVGGMIRCLDTKDMHQAWRKQPQGRSLGFVLQDLDIPCKNLHNAGNDAAFTLRAMLGLAVQASMEEK